MTRSVDEKAHKAIKEAEARRKKSCAALIATIRKHYPVGTLVNVDDGRGFIQLRITGHCTSWWHDPGIVLGTNTNTGKTRKFDWSRIQGTIS